MGKEHGGLRVRQMREFNITLLGKWCWRLLVDRGGMWYRVLAARYGEVAERLAVGGGVVLCGGGRYPAFVMVLALKGGGLVWGEY
jgi:hypothetical protein